MSKTIVVLEGDETGQELLLEALRVLDPSVTGLDIEFTHFDLTLENRRATGNDVVLEAAAAMRKTGLGLKAATITPPDSDDVGSPNRILREEIGAEVILRTGRRIPGVRPIAGVYSPISVVRMSIEDAYGAKEWREGVRGSADEVAYRTEKITRRVCRAVAGPWSFRLLTGTVISFPTWFCRCSARLPDRNLWSSHLMKTPRSNVSWPKPRTELPRACWEETWPTLCQ